MIKYTHFNLYKKDRPNPFFGVEDWDDEADDFFWQVNNANKSYGVIFSA